MITEKFKDIFWFGPKSKIKAGDGLDKGRFPFYTSSPKLTKWIDKEQHFDEALIFGTGGLASIHFADEPFSTSTDCLVAITTNKEIKTKFVYYYLFGNIHLIERGFKGAGLKHISKKYIENLDIPILPIETQNKIVTILDKASVLVKLREESIGLLNELLISNFLEIFGDPYTNPNAWPIIKLGDYLEYIGDVGSNGSNALVSKNLKMLDEEDYAIMIRTVNLSNNDFTKNIKYFSKETYDFFKKSKIFGGEIIMNKIGSNAGDFWLMPNLNKPVSLGLNQLVIRPKNLNKIFLFLYLSSAFGKLSLKSKVRGAATQSITKTAVRELEIFYPPLELQIKFEKYYLKYSDSLQNLQTSKQELSNLLSSLTQKVFNGQLNFNVDFELDALINEIDLQSKDNDLTKIIGDIAYLQRLVDKLNNQEFKEQDLYDKAKQAVFQLLAAKEGEQKIIQEFDESTKSIKLVLA